MSFSALFRNAKIATMTPDKPYGLIENGTLVIADGLMKWVGRQTELPDEYARIPEQNLDRKLITPALIDCHTHLVY